MDEELHKGMKSAECGCFKVFLHYSLPGNKNILIYELIVEIENRSNDDGKKNGKKKGKGVASKCF